MPKDYEDWKSTHRRFTRWRDKGHWNNLLNKRIDDADYVWLMIDASHVKIHPHAAGALADNEAIGLTKGGGARKHIWKRRNYEK